MEGVRQVRLREAKTLSRRQRSPHVVALETKRSRKRVGDADIVVDDDHRRCFSGRSRAATSHSLAVFLGRQVRVCRASHGFCAARLISHAIFSRFSGLPRGPFLRVFLGLEVSLSPILVRPVREQLEHDRVIRLLQAKYKRKFDVAINPGHERSNPVGTVAKSEFPDLVLSSSKAGRKLMGIIEVETGESVNQLEAMSQWARFGRMRTPFFLYVPTASVDPARRMCANLGIAVAELWAYHALGEQIRFTLIQRDAKAAAKAGAAVPAVSRGAKKSVQSSGRARAVNAAKKSAKTSTRKATAKRVGTKSTRTAPASKKRVSAASKKR